MLVVGAKGLVATRRGGRFTNSWLGDLHLEQPIIVAQDCHGQFSHQQLRADGPPWGKKIVRARLTTSDNDNLVTREFSESSCQASRYEWILTHTPSG